MFDSVVKSKSVPDTMKIITFNMQLKIKGNIEFEIKLLDMYIFKKIHKKISINLYKDIKTLLND
jgi:hypothetical protein